MHIVLAGFNYRPQRSTGDKNFWADLMPFFAKKIKKITILSIRQDAKERENYEIGDCRITVHYYSPKFL